MRSKLHFTGFAALCVIIANMIGTGVFTSLGFQLQHTSSPFPLIMLWVVGGVISLCGALSYAELGSTFPRSGGEYSLLSRIYHPCIGFAGGWVSLTIGFTAPVALAAMTFGAYVKATFGLQSWEWLDTALALILVIVLGIVHAGSRSTSGGTQVWFTILKVIVIVSFCLAGAIVIQTPQEISFLPATGDGKEIVSATFAISLIYVIYAYTGWNGATYLTNEIQNPQIKLPIILAAGTVIVAILYVALNATFLYVTPMEEMRGEIEVGFIAAKSIFGEVGATLAGLIFAGLLISTVSAMTVAGPRVLQVVGVDIKQFSAFAETNSDGIPTRAILLQTGLASLFILTGQFETVLIFAGFTMSLVSFFTVLGVFVARWRFPEIVRPYRVTFFPVTPIIYLVLTAWILWYVIKFEPLQSFLGFLLIMAGIGLYWLTSKNDQT